MTDITPTPELVQQWCQHDHGDKDIESFWKRLATQAARWGSDQELEACCEVLARELICDGKHVATDLRTVRRPKPPSLKEQAIALLNNHEPGWAPSALDWRTIRRALEQLDD